MLLPYKSEGVTQIKSVQCATDPPPPPSKVDDCWFGCHFGAAATLEGVWTC